MREKLKSHSPVLLASLSVTHLCSLFDLGFTLYALKHVPHAFEINPFFRLMLRFPAILYLYKLLLLPLLLLALYRARELRLARFGIWLCFAVFAMNTAYQLWSICLW